MRHILLDSYPLGALSHPNPDVGIVRWAAACRAARHILYVPEVIDYEVRRELLRTKKYTGVSNLDALKSALRFLPITSPADAPCRRSVVAVAAERPRHRRSEEARH